MPRRMPIKAVPSYIGESGQVGNWLSYVGTGGKLYDFSGQGNHGTINGPKWVDGPYGWALSFNGTDDWVEILHDDSLSLTGEFTLMAWAKFANAAGNNPDTFGTNFFGEKGDHTTDNANYIWKWQDDGNALDFCYNNGGWFDVYDSSGWEYTSGVWYLLTVVVSEPNNEVRFYVNDSHKSTVSQDFDANPLLTNNKHLVLGQNGNPNNEQFPGDATMWMAFDVAKDLAFISDVFNRTRAIFGV